MAWTQRGSRVQLMTKVGLRMRPLLNLGPVAVVPAVEDGGDHKVEQLCRGRASALLLLILGADCALGSAIRCNGDGEAEGLVRILFGDHCGFLLGLKGRAPVELHQDGALGGLGVGATIAIVPIFAIVVNDSVVGFVVSVALGIGIHPYIRTIRPSSYV